MRTTSTAECPNSLQSINTTVTVPAMKFISAIAAVLLALPFMAAAQCAPACCDVLVRALDGSGAGSKLVI